MATLEQQIAQKQDELARLKAKARQLENGEKIILGGMVLSIARKNPQYAKQLLEYINTEVNRESDKNRLRNIIAELQTVIQSKQPIE